MLSSASSQARRDSQNIPTTETQFHTHPLVYMGIPPIAPTGVDLQRLIRTPPNECCLEDLAAALTIRDVHFDCEGDGPLAQHPGFPGAVRQVIGSELMKTASREALAGVPCPWEPACGLHVFFNGQGKHGEPNVPPPWVIQTETTGANSVRITLRLFGLGLLWQSELADACHRAIERGVFIAGTGPVCHAVLHRSIESVWTDLQDPAPYAERALVSFTTPFQDEAADTAFKASPGQSFLLSLLDRCFGIARWHGIALREDLPILRDLISRLELDERAMAPMEWNRSLSQKGGESIAMQGYTGLLQMVIPDEGFPLIVRLLQIGAHLHAGQNIAFGQGRFDLYLTGEKTRA